MGTTLYKTKTIIMPTEMPRIVGNNQFKGTTIVAIDGGYSSVKGCSTLKSFCFPSYAKRISKDTQILGELEEASILLKDNKTQSFWAIGELAEKMMNKEDLDSTTDKYLFDRYRYQTDIYKIIMTAGLGIALIGTSANNDVYLQTGLPSAYEKDDSEELISILQGDYDFEIKVGNAEYIPIKVTLPSSNIHVMEQPKGTMYSCLYSHSGIPIIENKSITTKRTIIQDIGFGTEDIFNIRNNISCGSKTYSDTGMKAVFEEVLDNINREYHTSFKIFEFQKFLESGKLSYFDRKSFSAKDIEFEELLYQTNNKLCSKSINRLLQENGNLMDYDYLIVTGGTGESRYNQTKELLKGLSHLQVIPGNIGDKRFPIMFSNVRGYYMRLYNYLYYKRKNNK